MPTLPSLSEFSFSAISLGSGSIFGLLGVVCILLFALSLGRSRTLISLLSVYMAFVLQAVFPYFGWLQQHASVLTDDLASLRVGVLLLGYIISFLLLNRSVLKGNFEGDASFISVILMGAAQIGLLASMILNLAPALHGFLPENFLMYIANQKALFFWALAPLALLAFQKGN